MKANTILVAAMLAVAIAVLLIDFGIKTSILEEAANLRSLIEVGKTIEPGKPGSAGSGGNGRRGARRVVDSASAVAEGNADGMGGGTAGKTARPARVRAVPDQVGDGEVQG